LREPVGIGSSNHRLPTRSIGSLMFDETWKKLLPGHERPGES
jgi:hypothetical protein